MHCRSIRASPQRTGRSQQFQWSWQQFAQYVHENAIGRFVKDEGVVYVEYLVGEGDLTVTPAIIDVAVVAWLQDMIGRALVEL